MKNSYNSGTRYEGTKVADSAGKQLMYHHVRVCEVFAWGHASLSDSSTLQKVIFVFLCLPACC